jgi:hypothetical protein
MKRAFIMFTVTRVYEEGVYNVFGQLLVSGLDVVSVLWAGCCKCIVGWML